MGHHNVVDVIVWPFDPIIEHPQFARRLVVGNGFDPSHGRFLSGISTHFSGNSPEGKQIKRLPLPPLGGTICGKAKSEQ
jgi:hypothetical protein